MKKNLLFLTLSLSHALTFSQKEDSLMIRRIFTEALVNGSSYSNLDQLASGIGGRLAGSPQAAKAVEWTAKAMKAAGADTVFLQECMVPHWVRGEKETARFNGSDKFRKPLNICALGNSVATPAAGLTASLIEVKDLSELAKLGKEKIQGKIVFFSRPMDPSNIATFRSYGGAVDQRVAGPSMAARYGAVGAVVRSMSMIRENAPHTGVTIYNDSFPKIPACAISTNDADFLSEKLKKYPQATFFFKMSCKMLPDEKSYNVVGEIRGSEKPEEIIVVGGHLDSWDNGQGAHDDGAGIVQSIEVIRIFKAIGYKPKRTIRAVAFMNEENGGRGGDKYAELALKNKEKHIAAIESDAGGFTPRGIGCTFPKGRESSEQVFFTWKKFLSPYYADDFHRGGGGADIEELYKQGVPVFGLQPDSQRYFDYHHTANDTFDKINKRELELGGATMAAFIYLVSTYGF